MVATNFLNITTKQLSASKENPVPYVSEQFLNSTSAHYKLVSTSQPTRGTSGNKFTCDSATKFEKILKRFSYASNVTIKR